jgi:hypothetical protein
MLLSAVTSAQDLHMLILLQVITLFRADALSLP